LAGSIMLERLHQLEINVNELKNFRLGNSLDDIKNSLQKQWILRYGLFESVQIVIDVSCHLVSKYNLGNPKTYAECVELLRKFGYIKNELADKLAAMVGLRNILIREYVAIDLKRLYGLLDHLDDFSEFARAVKNYLTDE